MITFNNLEPSPYEKKKLKAIIDRVFNSGRYIGGVEVEQFEHEFADYVGAKHCIAVGNGYDALYIALKANNIGRGTRVAVPTNTCTPTWAAVYNTGATLVPIEPYNGHLICQVSFSHVKSVDVVIPVHLYGTPIHEKDMNYMCENYLVIEDACQAHGAYIEKKHAGTFGDMGCFSFYPTKNLGCMGDGGAIVTDQDELAEKARGLRRYGMPGAVNSCLDSIQAAILRYRLRWLANGNLRRLVYARFYDEFLATCEYVTTPNISQNTPNNHQFVIMAESRDILQRWLATQGIETMIHYPVLPHELFGFSDRKFSRTRKINSKILSLPIANVTKDDVIYICDKIKEFYDQ